MTKLRYLLVLAVVALVVAAPALGQSHASHATKAAQSKHTFIATTTVINVSGTDIYCAVVPVGGKPFASCFHGKLTSSGFKRTSYAIGVSDKYAAVDKTTSTKPIWFRFQAKASTKVIPKGKAFGASNVQVIAPGDLMAVKGSHLALAAEKTADGPTAMIILVDWPSGDTIEGSYGLSVGQAHVGVFQFHNGNAKRVYWHADK